MTECNAHQNPTPHPSNSIDEPLAVLSNGVSADPQFLHAVLCQLGLPRNPTTSQTFVRTSGRASLSLQAGRAFDGMKWVPQPLPSGTRPRLVLINLCSEAVRTRSPTVDIGGSVRKFLRRLNIDAGGKNMAQFRKQMLALSSCHMTLAMATAKGTTQVDAKPIDAFQAWLTQEDGQQTLWPGYIRLTEKFFESLMEHAVPLQRGPSTWRQEEAPNTLDERLHALVDEHVPDSDEGRRTALRHQLARRLLDDPVVYIATLDSESRAYFINQCGAMAARLCDAAGLVAEQRAEGLALVDDSGSLTDVAMPAEGTDAHATLLVAEYLATGYRQQQTDVGIRRKRFQSFPNLRKRTAERVQRSTFSPSVLVPVM